MRNVATRLFPVLGQLALLCDDQDIERHPFDFNFGYFGYPGVMNFQTSGGLARLARR